ncbi:MAG: hypothetical protein KIT80_17890 [Chitinophagaceae bacterium]|nr:hypothetical protein [Chitinophagaceae bacterium]MCW5928797.1 hypothetical protein [Chitinophagaceae bacterium]
MNIFRKLSLKAKAKDSAEYRFLKHTQKYLDKLSAVETPSLDFPAGRAVHFKHSGNAGDIIYAIPAMKAIAKENPFNLYLNLNRPADYAKHFKHPLGNVTLNQKMFDMLSPLLTSQEYITECAVRNGQHIDVDLDVMRDYPLLLDRGNIARWYFLVFPVTYDLNKSWLKVEADSDMRNAIVLARSQRYRAPNIRYKVLKRYPDVYFVGIKEEYLEMKKEIPNLKYRPVRDFLELASVIAGSRLFIGNQSFPFSIAEALKVNRLLEVYFECPNVTVYGDRGFDFSFQPQFEKLVKMRYEME